MVSRRGIDAIGKERGPRGRTEALAEQMNILFRTDLSDEIPQNSQHQMVIKAQIETFLRLHLSLVPFSHTLILLSWFAQTFDREVPDPEYIVQGHRSEHVEGDVCEEDSQVAVLVRGMNP